MDLWHPDADVQQTHAGLRMNGQNDIHRCTWHVTGDKLDPRPTMQQVATYLARVNYDPTLLYDPETGDVIQMLPGNMGGYALQNKGVETNRMGAVHVQIEVYFTPGYKGRAVFTDGPMVGMDRLMDWLDQLGIPRVAPLSFINPVRDQRIWGSASGHFGHCHAPLNVHTDPQAIDIQTILDAGTSQPVPVPVPIPPTLEDLPVVFLIDPDFDDTIYLCDSSSGLISPIPDINSFNNIRDGLKIPVIKVSTDTWKKYLVPALEHVRTHAK